MVLAPVASGGGSLVQIGAGSAPALGKASALKRASGLLQRAVSFAADKAAAMTETDRAEFGGDRTAATTEADRAASFAAARAAASASDTDVASGAGLAAGDVRAVSFAIEAGGKPIPGTQWVQYTDEEEYIGTPYWYNPGTGESVWTAPPEVQATMQAAPPQRRLLAGMGMESMTQSARSSLVASFIEDDRREQAGESPLARSRRHRREREASPQTELPDNYEFLHDYDNDDPLREASPPAAREFTAASTGPDCALFQFAKYLGMDLADTNLLWIAQEAMLAPLPEGWTEEADPTTGDTFYHHAESGESAWEHPSEEHYKRMYATLKQGHAAEEEQVGQEGIRKTWGGVPIALHSHQAVAPISGAEYRKDEVRFNSILIRH